MEDPILDERQPCRSCAGILSDFSMFDALKLKEGVNFPQTARGFFAAVDNGCLLCEELHKMARDDELYVLLDPSVAAFRCRPQSSSEARRDLIKNVQFTTTRPDSYDFKSCEIAVLSADYRSIFIHVFDLVAQ